MPNGYTWKHWIKLSPTDGDDETIILRQEFLEGHGPVRTNVTIQDDKETRLDLNKVLRQEVFGFRYRVTIRIELFDMEEQRALVKIVNALKDRDTTVSLSLDGGVTYKPVILRTMPSPRAIRNLTIVGATFELGLEAAELDDELVAIADGW